MGPASNAARMEAAEHENQRIMRKYSKETKVGEGTYAVVYLGHEHATGRKVAIKKIKVGQFKDGLDMSAIREIKFLRELRHPNIIHMLDVFSNKSNLNLVLEFLETDLEAVIKDKNLMFQGADVKSWMIMTLRGLDFCHQHFVLHRDLKPNNLLIAVDGTLKLADFGLAREFADEGLKMTCQVVTRWYRSPELLMGARAYSTGVDMWATGCIFAELMLRVPFMAGENDLEQLSTIFRALGTPTEEDWPGHSKLPGYVQFAKQDKPDLGMLFGGAGAGALDLLQQMLAFDPRRRPTARRALEHAYFTVEQPRATHHSKLPRPSAPLRPRALPPSTDVDGQTRPRPAPAWSSDEEVESQEVRDAKARKKRQRAPGTPRASENDVPAGAAPSSPARKVARRLDFA